MIKKMRKEREKKAPGEKGGVGVKRGGVEEEVEIMKEKRGGRFSLDGCVPQGIVFMPPG